VAPQAKKIVELVVRPTRLIVDALPLGVRRRLGALRSQISQRFNSEYRALEVATERSLCGRARLIGLQSVANAVAHSRLGGDLVECGVYRGGSAVVIAERLLGSPSSREMWLFDVFSGMPQPGAEDPPEAWQDVGKFVSSETIVRETFAQARVATERIHFVVGRYEDTLRGFRPAPIAFLHVDCDWYAPVRLCLRTFYDAVVPGGAVVLDDYGHWSGCRRAVEEFIAERRINISLTPIDYTSHYFFKP